MFENEYEINLVYIFLVIMSIFSIYKAVGYIKLTIIKSKNKEFFNNKNLEIKNKTKELKKITLKELSKFTGENNTPIYISVYGIIFDVSSGANFYGPGSGYNVFAGHDATKALTYMSTDSKDLDDLDFIPQNEDEKNSLDGWIEKFKSKYQIIGELVNIIL